MEVIPGGHGGSRDPHHHSFLVAEDGYRSYKFHAASDLAFSRMDSGHKSGEFPPSMGLHQSGDTTGPTSGSAAVKRDERLELELALRKRKAYAKTQFTNARRHCWLLHAAGTQTT